MWRGRKRWKPQAVYSTKDEPFVVADEKFKTKHKSRTKSKEDETRGRKTGVSTKGRRDYLYKQEGSERQVKVINQ